MEQKGGKFAIFPAGHRKNKRGQFFLIAAVVIIAVVVSIVTLSNYVMKKETIKLYDLGQELGIESQQVIDYGTYSELNETEMKAMMEIFIKNYLNYIGEDKNIYFIFGNKNQVNVIGYQELVNEKVCIKLNPNQPKCGDGVVNQGNEQCDDGNEMKNDGCSYCRLEGGCDKRFYVNPSGAAVSPYGGQGDNEKICEGEDIKGRTCEALGFESGGELKCSGKCAFDVSDCIKPEEETECTPLKLTGETEEFDIEGGDIYNVVIRIEDVEYEFKLKSGENFYFVIWQKIGGEKHVVTNE